MATIRTVLHGGLGNQLFQYFAAELECHGAESCQLHLYDNLLAQYASARTLELNPLLGRREASTPVIVGPSDALARLRLPKLWWKLSRRESVWRIPGYGVLVDGYFQDPRDLTRYPAAARADTLHRWRSALVAEQLLPPRMRQRVTHIRLGDFFHSTTEARKAAAIRLSRLQQATDLITDQERLVEEVLQDLQLPVATHLVPTASMSAWDLFRHFSSYEHIDTNGSSLAFWAATLANAKFNSTNPHHVEACRILQQSTTPPPPLSAR